MSSFLVYTNFSKLMEPELYTNILSETYEQILQHFGNILPPWKIISANQLLQYSCSHSYLHDILMSLVTDNQKSILKNLHHFLIYLLGKQIYIKNVHFIIVFVEINILLLHIIAFMGRTSFTELIYNHLYNLFINLWLK